MGCCKTAMPARMYTQVWCHGGGGGPLHARQFHQTGAIREGTAPCSGE